MTSLSLKFEYNKTINSLFHGTKTKNRLFFLSKSRRFLHNILASDTEYTELVVNSAADFID